MAVVLTFAAGVALGWVVQRLFLNFSIKVIGRDPKARLHLLDGLGYSALVRLGAAVDAEIAKRRGGA